MRVLGNAAMSLDGRIALPGGARARLSSPEDKARVHRLRNEVDAILVGVGTVLADDPELMVDPAIAGLKQPRHPLRVVLDSRLRTPATARVVKGSVPTVVFTLDDVAAKAGRAGHGVAEVLPGGRGAVELPRVLEGLRGRGVRSVLVEGGAHVHGSFLRARLYEQLTVYVAPVVLGAGAPSLVDGFASASVAEAPRLRLVRSSTMGEGALLEFERP